MLCWWRVSLRESQAGVDMARSWADVPRPVPVLGRWRAQVSPLTTFVEVIRTRDASTILPPLALMEAIYGGLWAAYIRANARTARSADFGGLSPFCFRPKSTSERARLAVSAAGMAWHSTTCTYGCRTQSAR